MALISSVPAVIDYLIQTWSTALPDVQVTDGQPIQESDDILCVGFTGEAQESILHMERDPDDLAGFRERESYEIVSMISTWRGRELDAKVIRDLAYGIADTMASEIARDQTLGGLVLRARLTTGDFAPWQTPDGATAVLRVSVGVVGHTRD